MARGLFESIDWLIAKDKKICCLIDNINNELAAKITNELGTPSFRSDTFANIPAAGQTGRMFVSTDTLSIYRDNGTTWDLISGGSSGVAGSGTINYLSKWTGATAVGDSQIFDNGTSVGIGTATPLSTSNLTISQANTTSGGIFITTPSQPTYGMILRNINNATTQNELLIGSINQPATGSRGLVVRGFNSGILELYGRNVDNTTKINTIIGEYPSGTTFFISTNNVAIGSYTDAGYKLNVNGSALIGDSSAPTNPAHINFVKSGNTSAGIVKITALTAGQGGTLILEGNAFQSSCAFRASPYGLADFTIGTDLYTLGAGTYDGYLANANGPVAHFRYANRSSVFWRGMTINEDGADSDTRIEGDTNQNLFFIDASVDNIGMGTNTPNASALLDISSTTKGFLPPRMTGAQAEAIASPAEGLMVYATSAGSGAITSKGWWGFEGATWVKLN